MTLGLTEVASVQSDTSPESEPVAPDGLFGRHTSVSVNGKPAFKEFDIEKEAGGTSRAVYRDIPCWTETGLISIDFAPIGKINGIEISIAQEWWEDKQ